MKFLLRKVGTNPDRHEGGKNTDASFESLRTRRLLIDECSFHKLTDLERVMQSVMTRVL